MRYKTLFRLLIKFLGVWIGCNGITSLVNSITNWIAYSTFAGPGSRTTYPYWLGSISGLTAIALALYLFFGGKWIVDLAIPSNRPYCHQCGYDLTGAVGDICNECGTPFRGEVSVTSHESR